MKSIKPGRSGSMMAGVIGIFMCCFGVVFTAIGFAEFSFMGLFGLVWTGIAISITVQNFKNATGKNRHSLYDIVDTEDEPDPLDERFGNPPNTPEKSEPNSSRFCPYCGKAVGEDFTFCNGCGKKLP